MIRPGHHRPIGTDTWMRFRDWPRYQRAPQIDDIIAQTDGPAGDPDEVERAYLVFGVWETATGYRLHVERVEYARWLERTEALASFDVADELWTAWTFYNAPRA